MDRAACNELRFRGDGGGHYESYFQRGNHPTRKLAFWIRYTIFEPMGRPGDAVGELWAIWFDGERGLIVPVKTVLPLASCDFARAGFRARIGESTLDDRALAGNASAFDHTIAWSLGYTTPSSPLLLLPEALYGTRLPKAKALVGSPLAAYSGEIVVDGERHAIDGWVGSQNHNWGAKHTDEYAWGQVAGFDDHPDSFLEVGTARLHIGPVKSPWLCPVVLRHEGREYRFDSLLTQVRAKASYAPFRWDFSSEADGVRIDGTIDADVSAFVGLNYDNPVGGRKVCLNTKLARCTVRVAGRHMKSFSLHTGHRAAFEMLGDARHPAVPMLEV